jgi:GntR family transcriptional regulator
MTTDSSPARLLAQLRDLIAEDQLQPGDRMPAEAELALRFGVSRTKVREALKLLEQDGVVHAIQGSGRFVSPIGSLRVERPMTVYESITEMLTGLGHSVSTVVLDVEETACDRAVAEALDLEPDDPTIRLTRLRLADEEPMVFSINTIVRECLPGPIRHRDWSGSLTTALEAHGSHIVSSTARVTAANLDPDTAERYDLARFDPWLLVEETCITQSGRRVMHALDYHRGSAMGFNVLRRR